MRIDEKVNQYIAQFSSTIDDVVDFVREETSKTPRQIKFLSAGWDVFYGRYLVVKAGAKKVVIVNDGCEAYSDLARNRML